MKGLFITGTDTGVGKTWVGTRLVEFLIARKETVVPRKPVESGCLQPDGQFLPRDALAYFEAVAKRENLETICPYPFAAAAAPPVAARMESSQILLADLRQHCVAHQGEWLIVEGAGGFYSPIADDGLNADLAHKLQLPVLLVVTDKLGCINHSLLTLEAIRNQSLQPLAIVMNSGLTQGDAVANSASELARHTTVPILNLEQSNNEFLPELYRLMKNTEQKKGQ